MCREVAKPPELACAWKLAEEKRVSLERNSESFSSMEYYLVSHSNFDTYIHQNQITPPEQKKDHTDYLASTSATKILALSIQSNAPKPNVFFLFTIGLGSRGILSSTTSRRQEISVRTEMEKQWVQRITVQRWRGQRGEQLPSEQYVAFGFWFFFSSAEGDYSKNTLRRA